MTTNSTDRRITHLERILTTDPMAEHFTHGVGSGNRAARKRQAASIDRSIDAAVELQKLRRQAAPRKSDEQVTAERNTRAAGAVRLWNSLRPGDVVPGTNGATIAKVNGRSIVTTSGTRWSQREITGLKPAEFDKIAAT